MNLFTTTTTTILNLNSKIWDFFFLNHCYNFAISQWPLILWKKDKNLLLLQSINTHLSLVDKPVSLEMYPFPALAGYSVTLRCLVWGTDQISNADFYFNTSKLHKGRTPTYEIQHVTKSAKGSYKCDAAFTHTANSETVQQHETSDDQVLEVYGTNLNTELDVLNDHRIFFVLQITQL